MAVTIKDLAEMSGYSVSTIARVLAGKDNVKEETRRSIERLLVEHNYRKGTADRAVVNTAQRVVLIVVNDISNRFYQQTIHSIQAVLMERGYLALVAPSENIPAYEEQYVRTAQQMRLAGIILMTPLDTGVLRELLGATSCPVVLVNRTIRSMDLDVVAIDNYRGGYMATEHLIQHGLRRLCHVAGHKNSNASRDRRRGFEDALRDNGLLLDENSIYQGDMRRKSGESFAEYCRSQNMPFDGVFFANDMMASGFINVALQRGIRIPDDISVVCFDESPEVTSGPVRVTTVSMDASVLGEQAAYILHRKIHGQQGTIAKLVYPPEIHERESVRTKKE